MSGHSKWSKIKHQKGTADIKKGQTFTKIANAIILAVRQGGGVSDEEANYKLRLAVLKAHQINMPKENINRAIERGKGKTSSDNLEEVIYEGYGPKGVAFLIEAITDNRQRTSSMVKNILNNNSGNLASPGSVIYNFKTIGKIEFKKNNLNEEEILEKVIQFGGSDLEIKPDVLIVLTLPEKIDLVKAELIKSGLVPEKAEIVREPLSLIILNDQVEIDQTKRIKRQLEELDDVIKVYTNYSINV